MSLFILLHCLTAFPHSYHFTAEILGCAMNSYDHHNIPGFLYGFGNEHGLGAKVYRRANRLVIAFRGTILGVPWLSTGAASEINRSVDNALFRCCSSSQCAQSRRETLSRYSYLADSVLFTDQAMKLFPTERIILTGHSLGAGIASIVGRIKGVDVLAFSSPGEKHISDQLADGSTSGIIHLGACTDPVYTGKCGSYTSLCRIAGYEIETRCHTGRVFCIGSGGTGSVMSHRARWLEHLVSTNERIVEMSEGCVECVSGDSFIYRILGFFHLV